MLMVLQLLPKNNRTKRGSHISAEWLLCARKRKKQNIGEDRCFSWIAIGYVVLFAVAKPVIKLERILFLKTILSTARNANRNVLQKQRDYIYSSSKSQTHRRSADEFVRYLTDHRLLQSIIDIGQVLISPCFHVVDHVNKTLAQIR